jgi:uncharacterized C2H2 Zn-finger protein
MQPLFFISPLLLPMFLSQPKPPKSLRSEKVKCPLCMQEFKSNKGLSQHHAKTHTDLVKSVPCGVCGKLFKHKYAVKFHVRQVHDKQTQVKCLECGKELYNKYSLRKHVIKLHTYRL